MYNEGSAEFNELITKSGGNALILKLTFSDFTIEHFTKLEYYGGSNNSDDIAIGTTNMAYLDVSTITDKLITNNEFLFEVGMELSDGTVEYVPMGYFTVQKPDSDEDTVNFKAYDRMQKFEKPYTSNLSYPTNSKKVLNELCTRCGVELATPITSPIAITDKLDGYTCREVLGYIAGIHGFFACFDRYGKLNLRWYNNTPIEKQIGLIWSLTKSQSDYTVEKVTLAKDTETKYTSGTGISGIDHSNPYATQAIADSIYASLGGFSCRPCEISMLDDIRLDPWDMLKVTYLDGSVLAIPVMSLEHSFTSGETRVKSFGKTDTENEYSYAGPTTQAMDRMATELLVANRIIATKVDAEWVNAHTVTADKLEATNARVSTLEATSLTAETADLRYANITLANIDTANVDVANIGLLFAKVGLIDRATIVDGHITGFLDAVEVNANKITAGTLAVDRLLIKDSSGNYKMATYDSSGNLVTTTVNGSVITERTITADHLVAGTITANEINMTNLVGNSAFVNAISTNSVVVGASNTANNALDTVNNLEIGGRNLLKDSANMTFSSYGGTKATTESNISVPEWGATDATRIYGTGGAYKIVLLKTLFSEVTVKGTSYTNSIFIKNNHATNSITVYNNLGSRITVKAGESKRVILTGIGNGISGLQYQLYTDTVGAEFDITYWHPKVEYGNVATDWSPAPEDISVENIYTPNKTTIDGGKITTGSIKADAIDVTDLFAKDITATGSITGATLYGTYAEIDSGKIGNWTIGNNEIYSLSTETDDTAPSIYGTHIMGEDPDYAPNLMMSRCEIGIVDSMVGYALYDSVEGIYGLCSYKGRNVHFESDYNSYTYLLGAATVISENGIGVLCDQLSDGLLIKEWDHKTLATSGYTAKLGTRRFLMKGNGKITIIGSGSVAVTDSLEENGSYINNTSISTSGTLSVTGATTLKSTLNVTGITTLSDRLNSSANICLDNSRLYYIRDAGGNERTAITLDANNKYSIATGGVSNTIQLGSSYTTATTIYGVTTFDTTVYSKTTLAVNDGTSLYARIFKSETGTTSNVGYGQLSLGNSIASGKAGNARGRIGLFGTASGYTTLYPGYNGTSSITINLPSSAGTLALTSSDKRLKENVKDAEVSGLDFINSIKLHQFDWKESGDHWNCGYIADELMEYDKHLVLEGSGGLNDDGTINPLCIDDFYLSAYQTKAIQELYKRIIELEEKIQTLKNAN